MCKKIQKEVLPLGFEPRRLASAALETAAFGASLIKPLGHSSWLAMTTIDIPYSQVYEEPACNVVFAVVCAHVFRLARRKEATSSKRRQRLCTGDHGRATVG